MARSRSNKGMLALEGVARLSVAIWSPRSSWPPASPLIGEGPSQVLHQLSHQGVGLLDGPPGRVEESALDVGPAGPEPSASSAASSGTVVDATPAVLLPGAAGAADAPAGVVAGSWSGRRSWTTVVSCVRASAGRSSRRSSSPVGSRRWTSAAAESRAGHRGPAPQRRLPIDRQSPRQQRPEGWPWTPIHMLGRADALGGDRRSNLPVPGQGTQRRGRRLRGPRNLTRLEPGSARPATKAGQHPGQISHRRGDEVTTCGD
jgi:hypothetical protein